MQLHIKVKNFTYKTPFMEESAWESNIYYFSRIRKISPKPAFEDPCGFIQQWILIII